MHRVAVLSAALVATAILSTAWLSGVSSRSTTAVRGTRTATVGPHTIIVTPDSGAAARVSVRGTSARERAVVRRILTTMGSHQAAQSVVLSRDGPGGMVPTITITPKGSLANPRTYFETHVVGDEIARELPRYVWLQTGADGTRILRRPSPPSPASSTAIAASIQAGVSAAGLRIRSITVFPLREPAVETVIRFREDQLFDDHSHAWMTAADPGSTLAPGSSLVTVQSPAGVALAVGGQAIMSVIPKSAPAILYRRPTHLTIAMRQPSLGRTPEFDTIWTLDCQARYESTFQHPRVICDRLIRDRWSLFLPQATDTACGGGVEGAPTIEISGQFAGQTIDYRAGGCSGNVIGRWARLLGVPERSPAKRRQRLRPGAPGARSTPMPLRAAAAPDAPPIRRVR